MQSSGASLEVIVNESGLEKTKADIILSKFKNYFELAADWERKAKTIVVTDEKQVDDMKMARTGRLLLREKRIAIENARKELKEQALREGKAIDGIANVLKSLIVPIEEYLEKQEKFVENKKKEEEERIRQEIERRMQEDEQKRIAEAAAEQERIRKENERLKQEAIDRERKIAEERKAQEAILAEEMRKQEEKLRIERAKAEAERKSLEEKARKEREAQEKKMAEERAKAEAERKAVEEKAAKERAEAKAKAEAERKEKERLAELLRNTIECPNCHHKFQLTKNKGE